MESLEDRRLLAVDWRNPVDALDVDPNGQIVPLDALRVINELNAKGSGPLAHAHPEGAPYVDTNGDQFLAPVDAILVINHLNAEGSGYRTLHEGNGLVDETLLTITTGQTSGARNYSVQIEADFDRTATGAAIEDLLAVYVVDPSNPGQTILDRGQQGTALFTLAGDKADYADGLARWDGSILTIDTTSLDPRNTTLLRFQLIRSDSDTGTSVTIKPLANEVDSDGFVTPRFPTSSALVSPGPSLDLSNLSTPANVALDLTNVRFNSTTGRYSAELTVRNDGSDLGRNVVVAFPSLPSGVTLVNPSGTTSTGAPYVNLRPAIASGGLANGKSSTALQIDFDDPTQIPFSLVPQLLAGTNQAPTLDPIGPLTVSPGGVLSVPVHASDSDGDNLSFATSSATALPTGTLLPDGALVFRPTLDQLGSYEFDLVTSDGVLSATQHITLNVTADPITTTRISGKVLAVDGQPLSNMPVEVGSVQGLTMSDGSFTLDLGTGPVVSDTLKVRGELYAGPLDYPFIGEKLVLLLNHEVFLGVNNVVDRPIYLPSLDVANGKQIDPAQDTTVTTAAIAGASVFVRAGTLMNQQGTPFTGVLSITEVPTNLTPAALPFGLHPDLVVTIQPGEMVFASPAPLSLPNKAGYAPGALMDLWSINPVSGQFDNVGTGQVSEDGSVINTISGGVRNSSWHIFSPPPETIGGTGGGDGGGDGPGCHGSGGGGDGGGPTGPTCGPGPTLGLGGDFAPTKLNDDGTTEQLVGLECSCKCDKPNNPEPAPSKGCTKGTGETGSEVEYRYGTLLESHTLPSYESLGVSRRVMLSYDSLRADPRPIVRFGFDNIASAVDRLLIARLGIQDENFTEQVPGFTGINGDLLGLKGGEHFWSIKTGTVRAGLQVDMTQQPTGVYSYTLELGLFRDTGDTPRFVGTSASTKDSLIHINTRNSPFGAGWGVAGLQEIVENPDGSALLVDGDGSEAWFRAPAAAGQPLISPPGDFSVLEKLGDGTFRRTMKDYLTYSFNASGKLSRIRDRNGNETRFEYAADGIIKKIIDPVGLETVFTATGKRITSITDPMGRVTQLQYDAAGNLTRVIDSDNSQRTWSYDSQHLMTGEVDQRGQTEQELWDEFGRLKGTVRKDGSRISVAPAVVKGLYSAAATTDPDHPPIAATDTPDVATIADANGNVQRIATDNRGQGVAAYDSIASLGRTDRNSQNLVTSQTDGRGNVTNYAYDARGNLTEMVDRLSTGTTRDLFPGRVFSTGSYPSAIATGDVNGDGNVDLVISNGDSSDTTVSVLLGRGDGSFQDRTNLVPFNNASRISHVAFVTLADMERDGDLDIVAGYWLAGGGSAVSVLVNQGGGIFAAPESISFNGYAGFISVGDVDGDGILDLGIDTRVARWNGSQFRDVYDNLMQYAPTATLADVNGDARPDLVGTSSVRLGNGDGTFGPEMFASGTGNTVITADLNGDGNPDRITTYSDTLYYYFGDGTGHFGNQQTISNSSLYFGVVVPVDIDRDGDIDLVAHTTDSSSNGVGAIVYLNQGNGTFPAHFDVIANAYYGDSTFGLAVADVDRDNNLDIIRLTQVDSKVAVFPGNGDGTFLSRQDIFFNSGVQAAETADLDGDGDLDIVASTSTLYRKGLHVLTNQGGSFSETRTIDQDNTVDQVRLVDVNGDGKIDIVGTILYIDTISIWLGDGSGDFGDPILIHMRVPSDLRIGDLNHDGKLDMVVARGGDEGTGDGTRFSVLLGNGDGTFADPTRVELDKPYEMTGITLADLDGDGNLDAITSGYVDFNPDGPGRVAVQLGAGDGTFGAATFTDVGNRPNALDTGDIDGDGDLDVVVANHNQPSISVLMNDGQGHLNAATQLALNSRTDAVLLRDVDGNGALDVIAGLDNVSVAVFPGDGRGGFFPRRNYSDRSDLKCSACVELGSLAAKDVTGDGVTDLIVVGDVLSILPGTGGGQPGGPKTWTYEPAFNRVTSRTDELGRQTLYDIDPANGNLKSVTGVVGEVGGGDDDVTRYTYTSRGLVASQTDPDGNVTTFDYDARGRMITITQAVGTADKAITHMEYDAAGNVTAVIDPNGNRTEYAYDVMNRPTRVTEADPDGPGSLTSPITSTTYDKVGNPLTITDARGNVTEYDYDPMSRLSRRTDPLAGKATYQYDTFGNVVAATDELGHTMTYAYDARNRVTQLIDPIGGVIKYEYDADDNLTSITDANGHKTAMSYDPRSQLVRQTDAAGDSWRFTYDTSSQLTASQDPNGHTTRNEYDDLGRLVSRTNAIGGNRATEYDAAGNLVAVTDELGRRTEFAYDSRNRIVSIVDPLNHMTQYDYDAAGNLIEATDPLGRATQVDYDALNRPTQTKDALGGVRSRQYDSNDNVTATTDELARTTKYEYDALDRRTKVTDPLDHSTTTSYDAVGNVTSVTDALGHATQYAYDALDRRVRNTDARSGVTSYAYDAVGNLTRLTDPVNNATSYAYDAADRLTSETNAIGATRSYQYDPAGNLIESIDRNGRVRQFEFDGLNRQVAENWLDSNSAVIRSLNSTYDAASQLTSASDPDSSYDYGYDVDGRLISQTNAGTPGVPGVDFTYAYDAANDLLTRADSIAAQPRGTNTYVYDALNRMTRVTQAGTGVAVKRVDLAYDAASQMTGVNRFSDAAGNQQVAASAFTWDNAGRLTALSHKHDGNTLASYSYVFDAANRITEETSADGTSQFSYDVTDQLTAADHSFQSDESYSYDLNGNRTNGGYQLGTNNRLLADGTFTYDYDAEGNRTRRTEIATGNVEEYTWDYRNRLTQVVFKNTSSTITKQVNYTYDVMNRRIAKSVDGDGPGASAPVVERYVYDGQRIALSFDGGGTQTHRYLHGTMIDEILADENTTGDVLWPLTDHQGTVRDLVDSAGVMANHLRYDSFGRVTAESNAAVDHLFGYTGRERDDETDLMYYRGRYYDPAVGRFISEDPNSFADRGHNTYRYVGNDPRNAVDPMGLESQPMPEPYRVYVEGAEDKGFSGHLQIVLVDSEGKGKSYFWGNDAQMPNGYLQGLKGLATLLAGQLPGKFIEDSPSEVGVYRDMYRELNEQEFKALRETLHGLVNERGVYNGSNLCRDTTFQIWNVIEQKKIGHTVPKERYMPYSTLAGKLYPPTPGVSDPWYAQVRDYLVDVPGSAELPTRFAYELFPDPPVQEDTEEMRGERPIYKPENDAPDDFEHD